MAMAFFSAAAAHIFLLKMPQKRCDRRKEGGNFETFDRNKTR
jgi:hypothetical protein